MSLIYEEIKKMKLTKQGVRKSANTSGPNTGLHRIFSRPGRSWLGRSWLSQCYAALDPLRMHAAQMLYSKLYTVYVPLTQRKSLRKSSQLT
jgi:hypothetical protein